MSEIDNIKTKLSTLSRALGDVHSAIGTIEREILNLVSEKSVIDKQIADNQKKNADFMTAASQYRQEFEAQKRQDHAATESLTREAKNLINVSQQKWEEADLRLASAKKLETHWHSQVAEIELMKAEIAAKKEKAKALMTEL